MKSKLINPVLPMKEASTFRELLFWEFVMDVLFDLFGTRQSERKYFLTSVVFSRHQYRQIGRVTEPFVKPLKRTPRYPIPTYTNLTVSFIRSMLCCTLKILKRLLFLLQEYIYGAYSHALMQSKWQLGHPRQQHKRYPTGQHEQPSSTWSGQSIRLVLRYQ